MWFTIVSIFYVLICIFLIGVVLLQQGKGGGMGSAFGGSTQTVFGGAGAGNFLTRMTAICATLFMVLSAVLAYLSSSTDRAGRTFEEVEAEEAAEAEAETVGAPEGATGEEAPPPPVQLEVPSRDTPEEAAEDPVIDALEQEVEEQAEPPAEPAAEEPAAEEPAAEEPAAEEPAARRPTKVRAPRPPRQPRPPADEPADGPAAEPAEAPPPAAEE